MFYAGEDGFVAGTLPFVADGLALGEPVLVAVPEPNGTLLRAALGADAALVRFRDMGRAGRNPGRIIPWILLAFVEEHAGRSVRIIGEPIWAGRSVLEYPACVQHEALINLALADVPVRILCPYDATRLEPHVCRDAERTHPVLAATGLEPWRSTAFAAPVAVVADYNQPLDEPGGPVETLVFDIGQLAAVRDFVADFARRAGVAPDRVADLQLAANELASNSVKHADGSGTVRVWQDDGHVVCEVDDTGVITDPLAGRVPPGIDSDRGRGLLLVNFLCDLVRIHTGSQGTAVRLYLKR
jgi:anti-sigma regulatory factor (Ser/Thr protein kinase)